MIINACIHPKPTLPGTGSALAREAVGAVFGGSSHQQAPAAAAPAPAPVSEYSGPKACDLDRAAFLQCMKTNKTGGSECDSYYDALKICQESSQ